MYFWEEPKWFLKIHVTLPKFVGNLRTLFEKEMVTYKGEFGVLSEITYESSVPYGLRFMIDQDITGMSWIRIMQCDYKVRDEN